MTTQSENLTKGDRYEFHVRGQLRPDWSDWLEGLAIIPLENGETLLFGTLPDQAALHGLLAKIRDLNLTLISVNRLANGVSSKDESGMKHPKKNLEG